MPKESSRNREWEKERRNRLNEAFTTLCKLLPCYDPAANTSKIDILRNATSHIEELQGKVKELISQETPDESIKKLKGEEYKKLQERIKQLVGKNEKLCALLREARISVPPGCAIKKFKRPLPWSNRILPEQAKILQAKELEKENQEKTVPRKFPNKKTNKLGGHNSTPKHRKAIVNRSENKKNRRISRKKKGKQLPKCVILLSQPSATQPCYIITNAPSNNVLGGTSTMITNSGLISNPLVSSKASKTVPPLGPGTLILANGTIMPVLPPQTVLPIPIPKPPIIVLSKNPTMSTTSSTNTTTKICTSGTKTLARIGPKSKYCLTRTTQVNKVPIPAFTSRYSNPEVVLKKSTVTKPEKKNVPKEPEKKKVVEEVVEKRKEPPCESDNEAKKSKVSEEKLNKEVPQEKETPSVPQEKEKEVVVEEKSVKKKAEESLELNINSELSNDIFASLQVPPGCQNPESTSPTAAFLLAFPLVSSLTGVKVTEVTEEENCESQNGTPTLLQIGTMDGNGKQQNRAENLTPSLLNLDNLSFFSSKDIGGFYNSFEGTGTISAPTNNDDKVKEKTNELQKQTLEKDVQQPQQKVVREEDRTVQERPQHHMQQQTIQKPQEQHKTMQHVIRQQKTQNIQMQQRPLQNLQPMHPQQQSAQAQPQQNMQNQRPIQTMQIQQQSIQNQHQQHSIQKQHQQQQLIQQQTHNHHPQQEKPYYNQNTIDFSYQSKSNHGNKQNTCNNYPQQKSFSCDTFTEVPKVSNNTIKSYPEPLYTNSSTYSYGNTSDNNFNQNYYKDIAKSDNRSYYSLNYENYADYRKNDTSNNYFSGSNYYSSNTKCTGNSSTSQKNKNSAQARPPINWMTTPDNRSDYILPQFTKENEFYPPNTFTNTQTTYFNTYPSNNETTTPQEPRKALDFGFVNSYQRNEMEDNQFSWSPTKIPQFLDPPHTFVSSTLPTLVGDLALGNNPIPLGGDKCQRKKPGKGYEGGNQNFLSVSQLVEPNKEAGSMKRRNSRSGGKKATPKRKEGESVVKNSYSAEALIGGQVQGEANQNKGKISVSSFLHDNIIPYFPSVELQQENGYIQQNQNFQGGTFGHNFQTTFQNAPYTPTTFIPTTTITSSYNFMHEVPPHDYSENLPLFPPPPKNKTCSTSQKKQQCAPVTSRKPPKRKHSGELPNFVEFPPFLGINSPILPDGDFHAGFLQPPSYACKNPGALLPPLPPPVAPTRGVAGQNEAGTSSLTNFNLSTIFPEINNKGAVAEGYGESRSKEIVRSSYNSTVQVSFNDKPTFSFTYGRSQSYNTQ